MSGEEGLSDPRLVLFIIYSLFVVLLAFCTGSHMVCQTRYSPSRHNDQVASESTDSESDGLIYELLSSDRKKEIDSLRENIFCRILFSLTLQSGDMLKRGRPEASNNSQSSSDMTQHDIEEGFENDANEHVGNDKSAELVSEDESSREYTHILIPRGGDVAQIDSKEKREVPIFCAVCLSEYEMNDEVSWSSNSDCTHVFHKECMVNWLVALGRRKSSMKRFPKTNLSEKKLLNYQLECPCCRQDFIFANHGKEEA